MVSLWDMVPVPVDVLSIPKVVQQELVRDASPYLLPASCTAAFGYTAGVAARPA
jgi:hypothetical protein